MVALLVNAIYQVCSVVPKFISFSKFLLLHLSENTSVRIKNFSTDIESFGTRTAGSACSKMDYESCNKRCAHGYETDVNNCSICECKTCPKVDYCLKNCLYGFDTDNNGCPICKCQGKVCFSIHLMGLLLRVALRETVDNFIIIFLLFR